MRFIKQPLKMELLYQRQQKRQTLGRNLLNRKQIVVMNVFLRPIQSETYFPLDNFLLSKQFDSVDKP